MPSEGARKLGLGLAMTAGPERMLLQKENV